jgi:hypothetical protein
MLHHPRGIRLVNTLPIFLVFIRGLFNYAVTISDYIPLDGRMNNELERILMEAVVVCFKNYSRICLDGMGKNHEKSVRKKR